MVERQPVMKRSCSFCQSDAREQLEEALTNGEMSCTQIDKDMGWRANTADRHFRNHMGQYHMAAHPVSFALAIIEANTKRGSSMTVPNPMP